MAITTAQATTIRMRTGDNRQPYMLQPNRIATLFTDAGESVDLATVYALQEIIAGLTTGSIDYPPDCGDKEEYLAGLRDLIELWSGGTVRITTSTTHAWRKDSKHTEEPTYD